jgi:hypothetical protein
MLRIPAQLDKGPFVALALRKSQPAVHLQARLIADHDLRPACRGRAQAHCSISAGERSTEALCLMLLEQSEIDDVNNITIICVGREHARTIPLTGIIGAPYPDQGPGQSICNQSWNKAKGFRLAAS